MKLSLDRVLRLVVDRPWFTLAIVVAISVAAVGGYTNPRGVKGLFFRVADAATRSAADVGPASQLPDVDAINLAGADAILVVESDQFFTQKGCEALRSIAAELESLDYVRRVLWMDQVPLLNVFGLPEPLFPRGRASARRYAETKAKALAHPLVNGQLLATDGKTLLMMLQLDWLHVRSDSECREQLRTVAEDAAAKFPDVEMRFLVTGRAPMYVTAMQTHHANQVKYQIIGYGMILLMAVLLFRGLAAVSIVALAPALGVFWTLGIIRYFHLQQNPFNDVVLPILLSLVGFTDGIHLMVQTRRFRATGLTGRDAARAGLQQVGLACALTSLTTAIGFGSLSLAHHQVVREFGWSCVIGVGLTFVAVITVIPLACSTWLGRWLHRGHDDSIVERNLGLVSGGVDWVLQHRRWLSAAAVASTILCGGLALTLRPDERNANSLPEHCEAVLAMRKLDQALGGLELGTVDVRWNARVAANDVEVLQVVTAATQLLRQEPLIGSPISLENLLAALPGEGSPADRMSLLDLLPPPLKRAFYTPEERLATVNFRVQDLGIAAYAPVFQRVERGLQSIAARHPDFQLELAGSAAWRWRHLFRIVLDLATSLGAASVIILVVLAATYRSVRLGLISIVPNLFPLAVTGAYLAVTGQALELVSVCAFTVCLGIAVDDTIHFLTRFEEERRQTAEPLAAIRQAFTGVGSALIMTTVILVAGFGVVAFSDSRDHRIFSTMGGLTIAMALLGDLIFLPALLGCFAADRSK